MKWSRTIFGCILVSNTITWTTKLVFCHWNLSNMKIAQIAKTVRSMSIRYRSDAQVSLRQPSVQPGRREHPSAGLCFYPWTITVCSKCCLFIVSDVKYILSYPPGRNGRHFQDDFKCIFVNENVCIWIKISLKFVPKGPIDNNQAIFWTNADPNHWHIFAALWEEELVRTQIPHRQQRIWYKV